MKFEIGEVAVLIDVGGTGLDDLGNPLTGPAGTEVVVVGIGHVCSIRGYYDYIINWPNGVKGACMEKNLRKRKPPPHAEGFETWDTFCDKIDWHPPKELVT